MNRKNLKNYLELHILFGFYSVGAIFAKLAGQSVFMSGRFIIFYAMVLANLFIYALVWQQLLKKLPLVAAYANKAITVVWGLLWGIFFLGEKITIWKIMGALIIVFGITMVVKDDDE